jgi:dipeptidyl aminopeptidase/acylaminoacyl peptidase
VGRFEETFVDRSRHTQRNGAARAKPERTLRTLVLYPAHGSPKVPLAPAGTAPLTGPWPLVVFSHGSPGLGTDYVTSLRVLASAGYLVVAPDHPLSKADADGGVSEADVPEQSRDVGFLISQVLGASKSPGSPLDGTVDADRIGVAGHSLGAITALGAGYSACCADRRIKAVAEWAGILYRLEGDGRVAGFARHRPLMIVHGTKDTVVDYGAGRAVYRRLGPPKYFVTLPGAGHVPPYVDGEAEPRSRVAVLATVDFFDRYLKGDPAGIDRLHSLIRAAGPGVATEQETG